MSRRHRTAGEGGFALLSVLWILVGVSALAMGANLVARDAVAAARNRADLARARWHAEDCLERTRAAIAAELARGRDAGAAQGVWSGMHRAVASSALLADAACDIRMAAEGSTLDINSADEEILGRLLFALSGSSATADSLRDALADWRDRDDVARPHGAEREWYRRAGLPLPRDSALADPRELARIRGFDRYAGLDSLLGVEAGKLSLNHAPALVLAPLPGLTPEAVARLGDMKSRGEHLHELAALEGQLSPPARMALLASFAELATLVVLEPDAWIVTSRARAGTPPVTAALEIRLARAGERAAVLRRRTWIE
jgi:general secretion pathway protein K